MNHLSQFESNGKLYGDITEILLSGQKQWYLRNEPSDHPCNRVPIMGVVLRTAKVKGKKLYAAFIRTIEKQQIEGMKGLQEVEGSELVVLETAKTFRELLQHLSFACVYSMYAPSNWYRLYRTLFGFSESSKPYQTEEMQKDSSRRVLGATCIMAGATVQQANEITQELIP